MTTALSTVDYRSAAQAAMSLVLDARNPDRSETARDLSTARARAELARLDDTQLYEVGAAVRDLWRLVVAEQAVPERRPALPRGVQGVAIRGRKQETTPRGGDPR